MKASSAVSKAIKFFEKENIGDFRSIKMLEEDVSKEMGITKVVFQIEYAIEGDYTESNNNPFIVTVSYDEYYSIVAKRDYWVL